MVVAPCLTVKPHPDRYLVTEPSVYTMRSCVLLFSSMRSLTLFCLLPILDSALLPRFSVRSVSQRCRNRFRYLSHSLVCLSSVSWHTCSTESSAWPIPNLPHPVCVPLCLSRLSVCFALVESLAWTSWSQWVCSWWFRVWLPLPRSALCPTLADLSVLLLWGLVRSQWRWAPRFDTVGKCGVA